MISTAAATTAQSSTIAALWNQKRLDLQSCWSAADAIDADYVDLLLANGMSVVLALEDETPVGFGLWSMAGGEALMVALMADDEQVYYHLMAAYCQWGQDLSLVQGNAELGTEPTTERAWMNALEVIEYTPIGFLPLGPGEDAENRVPCLLRASCNLAILAQAVSLKLEIPS